MENNPAATLPDGINVVPAAGGANVSEETISLHELVNKELGTNYGDDDAALQGLKQTKDYVGRVGQVMPFFDKAKERNIPTSQLFEAMDKVISGNAPAPAAQPPASVDTHNLATKDEVRSLQRDIFYEKNPQFQGYRQAIDGISDATGKSPAEIVVSDAYKGVFENASGFDRIQKEKSVLQTNPRLGVATDNMTKAQEALRGGNFGKAADLAVGAVMETIAAQEGRK
jgi:hypothetical protein